MKYDTFVITDASAQVPELGSHVAETGLHQVSTATSVTMHAMVARTMIEYRMYFVILLVLMRRRATQIEDLMGTVLRT
jgi:hypothetical protein